MSVVISSDLVLGSELSGGQLIDGNNPLIGYQQLATIGNITTTTANASYPAINLVNPATYLRWQATTLAIQYITMALASTDQVDYVGIARHNFYTAQIAVSLELFIGGVWTQVVAPFIPPDNGPILMRFTPQLVVSARVKLAIGTAVATAAVVYAGKLLVVQRRLYVGHSPITLSKQTKITSGRSESGNFLGRIVVSQSTGTKIELSNLTPDWYRTYFKPFVDYAKEFPFFFAWRPGGYPYEVGYCWTVDDPIPSNQRSNGMMSIGFEVGGIV